MIFTDAHQFLIDLGYEYTYVPDEWEEDGDGERGPDAIYYPAFGQYIDEDADSVVHIDPNGSASHRTISFEDPYEPGEPWFDS